MSTAVKLRAAEAGDAASRAAITTIASLGPLYFLLGLKSRIGLDHLHIGLLQVLFILAFRFFVDVSNFPAALLEKFAPRSHAITGSEEQTLAVDKSKSKAGPPKKKTAKGPRFEAAKLDSVLHSFLSIIDPEYTSKIPTPKPSGTPAQLPLSQWKIVHDQDELSVLLHPTMPALYAICAHLPDVPLRKLFGLLVDIEERPRWDGLCEGAENLEDVRDGWGRVGNVLYMKMKGMWPVKPKDLVLLSVVTRLPTSKSLIPNTPDDPVMRLVCATTSVEHPSKPAQSGYTRMTLGISGFMAESDGGQGSRLVQITDLSGLGSVPGFILQTVTGKMIPASLKKVGKFAKEYKPKRFPDDPNDESWIPPVIGEWKEGLDLEGPSGGTGGGDEGDESEEGENEDEDGGVPPGRTRSLHDLVAQLKSVTSRLAALDSSAASSASDSSSKVGSWLAMAEKPGAVGWSIGVGLFGAAVGALAVKGLTGRKRMRK